MKVLCEVDIGTIENEQGRDVPGVTVTCCRCAHSVKSYGTTERSTKRCFDSTC